MAAQGFESLSRAHTLALSARRVTLKLESGLKVKCGKRDSEIGGGNGEEKRRKGREREKKELTTQQNMIKAYDMLMHNSAREPVILYN